MRNRMPALLESRRPGKAPRETASAGAPRSSSNISITLSRGPFPAKDEPIFGLI